MQSQSATTDATRNARLHHIMKCLKKKTATPIPDLHHPPHEATTAQDKANMDSDLRKCTFGDSQFFFEKIRYNVRESPKKISAVLLSFTSREKGESHDRNQKEAIQAGVARCLKQLSDWFKRTPSRFEMRV